MKKIYITRAIPQVGIDMLTQKGFEVHVGKSNDPISQKELIRAIKGKEFDGIITLLTDAVDAKVFDTSPSVRIVSNYATGFDNINLVDAKNHHVTVANAPAGHSARSVAEFSLSLTLALLTRIVEADDFVRKGKYKGWSPMNFIGSDMQGKTVGLIGAGRIGSMFAKYARSLDLTVLYTDIKRNPTFEQECGAQFCPTLVELLPRCDVVSIHVPLLPSTRHLMNEEMIAHMKKTAVLINTSRGPVVDEKALEVALREKRIAGAALDVFEFEPKISRGMRKLPNVILTPHIASASDSARNEMAIIAAQNIIDYFEGKVPANIVTV